MLRQQQSVVKKVASTSQLQWDANKQCVAPEGLQGPVGPGVDHESCQAGSSAAMLQRMHMHMRFMDDSTQTACIMAASMLKTVMPCCARSRSKTSQQGPGVKGTGGGGSVGKPSKSALT